MRYIVILAAAVCIGTVSGAAADETGTLTPREGSRSATEESRVVRRGEIEGPIEAGEVVAFKANRAYAKAPRRHGWFHLRIAAGTYELAIRTGTGRYCARRRVAVAAGQRKRVRLAGCGR